jgi:hypothetical protein
LHAVEDGIYGQARFGGVIANFPITKGRVDRKTKVPRWLYVPEDEMTPEFFAEYSRRWEHREAEGQCLVIIDEAHRILNSRSFFGRDQGDTRMKLLRFLSEHRHYGYDVILVAQSDIMIDKQARPLIELEVKHMRLDKQYWFLPIPVFLRVTFWYGMKGFRGHLEMALWSWARGRYDHMFMRRAERERARSRAALASEAVPLVASGQVHDIDSVSAPQEAAQVTGGSSFVPERVVGDDSAISGREASDVSAPSIDSVNEDAQLVVSEANADEVSHFRTWPLALSGQFAFSNERSDA